MHDYFPFQMVVLIANCNGSKNRHDIKFSKYIQFLQIVTDCYGSATYFTTIKRIAVFCVSLYVLIITNLRLKSSTNFFIFVAFCDTFRLFVAKYNFSQKIIVKCNIFFNIIVKCNTPGYNVGKCNTLSFLSAGPGNNSLRNQKIQFPTKPKIQLHTHKNSIPYP